MSARVARAGDEQSPAHPPCKRRPSGHRLFGLMCLAAAASFHSARADDTTASAGADAPWWQPQAFWVDPGVLSYHFDRHAGYREDNWGLGGQIDLPHSVSVLGGTFINSDNARTHYAGVLWQPWSLGPVKAGAVVGGFDGYPHYQNGAWFPAALPWITVEAGRFGANFTVIPNYGDRLHGAVVMQLMFKIW